MIYDEDGNPLTSTLAEYGMLRAPPRLPRSKWGTHETPSPMNPLGAKGIGESATVGSTPAVQNTVVDALFTHRACATSTCPAARNGCGERSKTPAPGTLPDHWREPPAAFADLPVRPPAAQPVPGEDIDI